MDIFLATAVYVVIPNRWTDRLFAENPETGRTESQSPQLSISAQLAFASDTIRELETELSEVSGKFRDIDCNNIETIYNTAANTVCRGCTKMLSCWDDKYNDTIGAFNPVSDILRTVSYTHLPTTQTLDRLIAAAAIMGFNKGPPNAYKSPAATGIPKTL